MAEEPEIKNGQTDYKALGFMCGLEIHQRLATEEKLFCSCATGVLDKSVKPIATISRYQRAVAGELGSMDKSAEFEQSRGRAFTYNVFEDNTCLVDIDEEPPHDLNREALEIALSIASSMQMHLVDEIQPMRKGVIDGSDPSAFQRTMLVGLNGSIKVNKLNINIPLMSLEEESSGIASSTNSSVIYNTDRLAIPLVEIDTDANIPDPKTAKAVALYIGTMLRLTGKVQRGIGSIRQDVNMSIKDGARVEIKGVQELGLIDKYIENEVERQKNLIAIKSRLIKARAKVGKAVDATAVFTDTKSGIISDNLRNGGAVFAFMLSGFRGILGLEINPNRRLGTEISDYAKMAGVNGIIHSDEEMSKYSISDKELVDLREKLGIKMEDSFIIVAGKRETAIKAIELAVWRADYSLRGVPKETRMAYDNDNCTSKFLRPLPTGSRMYPETDIRPIAVTEEIRKAALKLAPDVERERAYLDSKIRSNVVVEQLITSPKLQLFKSIIEETKVDPEFAGNILTQKFTELRRSGIDVDSIPDKRILEAFRFYANGKITKQGMEELIKHMGKDESDIAGILVKAKLMRIKGKELEELIASERKEHTGMSTDDLRNRIMAKCRLNVDGSELNSLLKSNP
jgi:glutamyl-tRNA(Gln) amidotransferase subunit E